MIASKVKISPETRARLDNQALSPIKKRELRECLVKERIRNTVRGACTKQELVAAAGYGSKARTNEYAKGMNIINSMIRRGIITHNGSTRYRKEWTVLEDMKTKQTPKQVADMVIPSQIRMELKEFKNLTSIDLVDMAKEFAWVKNSDSLREFIEYVKNAVK